MSVDYAVRTDGLIKTFSGMEILTNCCMNVQLGTIYGFLGPNGAGKTTLMKILTGLLQPTAGSVEVLGLQVVKHREEILRKVGSLIEVPVFFERLSAEANIRLHLEYMSMTGVDIKEMLEMVGLTHTGQQAVSTFSLGMRQRLAIARALSHKPELLILDEPINGLDPMGIREMRDLFVKLVKEHKMTILLSSHILSEIEHIADTVGVITRGTIVRELSMCELRSQVPGGLEDYFFGIMSGGHGIA
ncbi:ABC transporter ATP-binding protein [Paenibacillus aquistagni]|uniref:ABC-2 type transport system ATP-binding protein n=1 Tax=Paenibacillus aquistagni TaxID=1852522 RepID=A0A1X7IT41_9BACL|nr:ATP-binding cassette domain-containing protein [Paenibacillus aquistagni]SMG18218.1 ABC-2 type transport system ATP-binding protein [Paenibacillus aquistagni]